MAEVLRQAGCGMKNILCPLLTSGVTPPLKLSTFVNPSSEGLARVGTQEEGVRRLLKNPCTKEVKREYKAAHNGKRHLF